MDDQSFPNLYIIGAPKCGTTSLFTWLAEHPETCRSLTKEPNFFLDEELDYIHVHPNHRSNGLIDYLAGFERVNGSTRVKLEGSTHYLYSKSALNFIAEVNPVPHVIVQVRSPVNRIWSHFHYIKKQANAPITIDFPTYVDALLENGKVARGSFTEDAWAQHLLEKQLDYSNYVKYLRRWRDRMPQDHLKIFVLEEMAQRKRDSMNRVADWLGIDPSFYDEYSFKRRNVARSQVSLKLRRSLGKFGNLCPAELRLACGRQLDRLFPSPQTKFSTSERKALAKLASYFSVPNQRLHEEFGLNLSSWSLDQQHQPLVDTRLEGHGVFHENGSGQESVSIPLVR